MIRFVDLRGQDTGSRFAFFDTVTDQWIEDETGSVAWQTWEEVYDGTRTWRRDFVARLAGLAPDWTRTPEDYAQEDRVILTTESGDHFTRAELVAWLAGTP